MRWGTPQNSEIGEYKEVSVDGVTVYVHEAVKCADGARIEAVTGGVGTKLILLGYTRKH